MKDVLSLCARAQPDHGTRYAAALARLLDGSLSALCVCEPVSDIMGAAQPAAAGLLVAWQQDRLTQARDAGATFPQWAEGRGCKRARWLVAQAPVADAVAHAAAWHDLLVLPADAGLTFGTTGTIGRVLLAAGSPAIVVPEGHEAPPSLDVVAVAWNGAIQATRALHASLPLLRRAQRVVLLAGTRSASFDRMIEPPDFDPEAHLAAHAVRFETCVMEHPDERSGDEILERAVDMGAGLLVMGAWGRTRTSELLLGGATRHVLQAATLPVFLRH
jgi:nucleotide-binding universal stress UspA family protein